MDFVQQLKVFIAVTENSSFARAAESLRMTRPSVTNAVNNLEARMGVRLLQRTTRRTSLTGEGELLYEKATQLLSDVAGAENLFGGAGEAPRGRLRVDIPVAIAKPLIIPHLADFQRTYPGIDIILGVSDQPVDLLAEGIDCVLRIGDLPISSMVGRVVASMAMVTCAAPKYLAERGIPESVEDLLDHKAVNYFSGRGHRAIVWHLPGSGVERAMKMKSAVMVNDTEAFVALALAGHGLIQVPGLVVADHLEAGRLIEVLPEMKKVRRPLSVMYPNRQYLSTQVRAFIEWITELARANRGPWLEAP
ncbi:LysR family transcriptional regulator [Aliidongia dinghuensis]|nr:LysR family transcriptional regulator [Aliidongia dinghuensis]